MPNNPVANEVIIEELDEEEHSIDDFEFIIDANGDLKSMVIPEHLMSDPPEEIQLIMRLYGIEDLNMLDNRTLH
jgi:hypothetical protein